MNKDERWWRKKRYWIFCILSPLMLASLIHLFFFPETPPIRSLIYAVASTIGVLIAYFAYVNKSILKMEPKTVRRIITIMGGAFFVGLMVWSALVYLCIYLQLLNHPVVGILLGVALIALMLIFAFIFDKLGKRRDYEPLISESGNI